MSANGRGVEPKFLTRRFKKKTLILYLEISFMIRHSTAYIYIYKKSVSTLLAHCNLRIKGIQLNPLLTFSCATASSQQTSINTNFIYFHKVHPTLVKPTSEISKNQLRGSKSLVIQKSKRQIMADDISDVNHKENFIIIFYFLCYLPLPY